MSGVGQEDEEIAMATGRSEGQTVAVTIPPSHLVSNLSTVADDMPGGLLLPRNEGMVTEGHQADGEQTTHVAENTNSAILETAADGAPVEEVKQI
ncbi:unnamed protein product [Urochloa humidicola]